MTAVTSMFEAIAEHNGTITQPRATGDPALQSLVNGSRVVGVASQQRIRATLRAACHPAIWEWYKFIHLIQDRVQMSSIENTVKLLWQEQKFKLMTLQAKADEFEDIFSRIMRAANGDSYHVARSGGKGGDASCDGWDSATKTLYAVYAPFSRKRKSAIRQKILKDFYGARDKWPEMRQWRMVHNDFFGLSAELTRELEVLRSDPRAQGVRILSDWNPQELWRILRTLPDSDRYDLLGMPTITLLERANTWDDSKLRQHGNIDQACLRSTMQSLSQLCDGYQTDSILEPLCASAMARALTTWWMDDQDVFDRYVEFLMERCEADPFEASLTSMLFVMACMQIGARRLGLSEKQFIEMYKIYKPDILPGINVVAEIALEQLESSDTGFYIENMKTRKKFIVGCGALTVDLITMLSEVASVPAIYILQDLIIFTQRIQNPEYVQSMRPGL